MRWEAVSVNSKTDLVAVPNTMNTDMHTKIITCATFSTLCTFSRQEFFFQQDVE